MANNSNSEPLGCKNLNFVVDVPEVVEREKKAVVSAQKNEGGLFLKDSIDSYERAAADGRTAGKRIKEMFFSE